VTRYVTHSLETGVELAWRFTQQDYRIRLLFYDLKLHDPSLSVNGVETPAFRQAVFNTALDFS